MEKTSELVFRQITPAEFFNINKKLQGVPPGSGKKPGGGQSYIDIPVKHVGLDTWRAFFHSIKPEKSKSGPVWDVLINSLGLKGLGGQNVEIGQRATSRVNIRSQKIFSKASNRVFAWHPDHGGFPRAPSDISDAEDPRVIELAAGVRIFILKTAGAEYWAGWLRTEEIERLSAIDSRFEAMLVEPAGHLSFDPMVEVDVDSLTDPFGVKPHTGVEGKNPDPDQAAVSKKKPSQAAPKKL